MMDMGCHRIELFTNLFGPIKKTSAFLDNIIFKREVEDIATAHFEFESGATGLLVSAHGIKEPKDTLDIYGEKGSIHVAVLNEGTLEIITDHGNRIEKHPNPSNFHQALIEDFTHAALENKKPAVTGEMGMEINMVLDKIYNR